MKGRKWMLIVLLYIMSTFVLLRAEVEEKEEIEEADDTEFQDGIPEISEDGVVMGRGSYTPPDKKKIASPPSKPIGHGSLMDTERTSPPPTRQQNPGKPASPSPINPKGLLDEGGKTKPNPKGKKGGDSDDDINIPSGPILPISPPLGGASGGIKPIGPIVDPYAPGPHNGWGYYNEFNYPSRLARPRAMSFNEASTARRNVLITIALVFFSLPILFS